MERLAEQEAQKLQDTECTFSPQILTSPGMQNEGGASPDQKKKQRGTNKWEYLYNQAEKKKKGQDRTAEEIEWERSQQECKFAPEIHEVNVKGTKTAKVKVPVRKSKRTQSEHILNLMNPAPKQAASPAPEAIVSKKRQNQPETQTEPKVKILGSQL